MLFENQEEVKNKKNKKMFDAKKLKNKLILLNMKIFDKFALKVNRNEKMQLKIRNIWVSLKSENKKHKTAFFQNFPKFF